MAEKSPKKIIYQEKDKGWLVVPDWCKSCGICIEKCPVKCLSYDKENNEYLGMPTVRCDVSKCITCHTCESFCPDAAITVWKENER
jgi:2-oxoglutarate ferredoxin oxidoreductase subunit delta